MKYKHGPTQMLGQQDQDAISELVMANPAIYLDELQHELHLSTGNWASVTTIFCTICGLGLTPKILRHIAMQRSDVKRAEVMEKCTILLLI